MSGPYDDIIDLPRPVSGTHARMSMLDRAAQFSPFAALSGYEAAVEETARLTRQRIELDVDAQLALDRRLSLLRERISEAPRITVTHFVADPWKEGGAYLTVTDRAVRLNSHEQWLLLEGGTRIDFEDILTLEGELFRLLEE